MSADNRSIPVAELRGWTICTRKDASPSETYAAEELQRLLEASAGLRLEVRQNAPESSRQIRVHGSEDASLGEEGVRLQVAPDAIVLAGGLPRGVLYAVYEFAEQYLGVRFLTVDHEHIPDASGVSIPCGEHAYATPFAFRWSYYRENSDEPAFAARLRVNTVSDEPRLGGRVRQQLINHSFHWLVPYDQYGESHPEYYAVVDGKRDTETHGGGPQLCVTNPDIVRIAAGSAIAYLDSHPGIKNVSVSQADTNRYCHCEACEAVNEREGTPMGSNLQFVNAVAELIEERHPDAKVGTLAYWYTRQRPKTMRPQHNVQIQLCSIECCTLHAIDDPDCETNRAFCRDMAEWGEVSDDIWVWNYNTNFRFYDLPFPNLRSIGPNVRYFLRNGAKGIFMQANGNGRSGEMCDLRNHLISRMLWNPSLDDRAVCEEFVRLHYGAAADRVLEYVNWLHDNAGSKGVHPGCFPKPEDVGLNPETARRAFDLWASALGEADSDDARMRVEKGSIAAYRALIDAGGLEGDELKQLVLDYIALCGKHGMTRVSEHQSVEDAFPALRERVGLPAS